MDRKWRALIIVCVGIFMLLLDITVVNVALPDIQRELHTSFTDLQWVVDAYALTLATAMLNAGSLGDLLGRKRIFVAGVLIFTAASAACGSATSPLFLILARGAQGIGGAVMFALSLAILSQEFHGRELALFGTAAALLLAFVLVEWRQDDPMLDLSLFRVPTFSGAQIAAFAMSSAMFSQFLYLTLYLQNVLGYSPIGAGLRFMPLSL